MRCYQEITLIPNADISRYFLWSKTFHQIHLGLVEMQDERKQVPIGLSFPEYKMDEKFGILGSKLRLLAQDEAMLTRFDANKWLARLSDYVHCTGIRPVPGKINCYAIYQREQPKTSKERLARRYAKRHNIDYEAALNSRVELSVRSEMESEHEKKLMSYSEMPNKIIATPFIRLNSSSTGNTFCLWIKKREVENSSDGTFTTYGLSATATVPDF